MTIHYDLIHTEEYNMVLFCCNILLTHALIMNKVTSYISTNMVICKHHTLFMAPSCVYQYSFCRLKKYIDIDILTSVIYRH